MYQLSHEITDTKRPLQQLLNEVFFEVFLKHPTAMSYGTFATSGPAIPAIQTLGEPGLFGEALGGGRCGKDREVLNALAFGRKLGRDDVPGGGRSQKCTFWRE
jgi:hypothetical protein